MAKQVGPIFLERTIDGVIFYKMDGKYYVRMVPSFPDIRRSPRFRGTMQSARRMGRASKIGATLYAVLPGGLKQFSQYRVLTGAAFHLLKAGKTDEEALELLWVRQKDLVERGCAIAATVYDGLAAHFRQEWMLWAFAEEAMAMLEESKPDEAVLAVLWKLYASEFEEGYRAEGVFLHELPLVEGKAIIEKRDIEARSGMVVLADGKIVVQTLLDGAEERQGKTIPAHMNPTAGKACKEAGRRHSLAPREDYLIPLLWRPERIILSLFTLVPRENYLIPSL